MFSRVAASLKQTGNTAFRLPIVSGSVLIVLYLLIAIGLVALNLPLSLSSTIPGAGFGILYVVVEFVRRSRLGWWIGILLLGSLGLVYLRRAVGTQGELNGLILGFISILLPIYAYFTWISPFLTSSE